MPRTAFLLIVLVYALTSQFGCAESLSQELGRGKQWVRSHHFYLSGLTQNQKLYQVAQYRGAGLNTLLAWDPWDELFQKSVDAGLSYHYHMHQNHGETVADYVAHVRKIVEEYPGCTGVLFHDEPQLPVMNKVGEGCYQSDSCC